MLEKYRPSESYPDPTPTLSVTTDDLGEDSGRYRLAMQGSNGIEVSFEIEPSKARVVSFNVETMGASNGFERSCTDEAGGSTAETSASIADSRQPEESPSTSGYTSSGSPASVNRQITGYGGGNKQPVQIARRCREPCPARNGEFCDSAESRGGLRRSPRKRRADTGFDSLGKRKKGSVSEAPANTYRKSLLYRLLARERDLQACIRPAQLAAASQHYLSRAENTVTIKAKGVTGKAKGVTGKAKGVTGKAKGVIQSAKKPAPAVSQFNVRNAEVLGSLPDGRLIIKSHRQCVTLDSPTAISLYNEHWSSVEILNLSGYIQKFIVIDEKQFLMLITIPYSGQENLILWKEVNDKWSYNNLGCAEDVSVSSDKKILTWYNGRNSTVINVWAEHDEEWQQFPQLCRNAHD